MNSSTNGTTEVAPMNDFGTAERDFRSPASASAPVAAEPPEARPGFASPELLRFLAEVKGQAQFLLYLADQLEESLAQLAEEHDACHGAFLLKVLTMYSAQLETKHQGLGEKIAETCQEVYVTVHERERDS